MIRDDDEHVLEECVGALPTGAWAVGVSGGADSIALLDLLVRHRPDLPLHVVHLDHQTRGQDSTADAGFVADLSARMKLPCTIARREQVQPLLPDPPANASALYRMLRLTLFRQVVQKHRLDGVILAHHADDQAETVLQRLLRNSSYAGLAGMSLRAVVNDLLILRPLLPARRAELRAHLTRRGVSWREDQSNQSPRYLRNRLRRLLAASPALTAELLNLAGACAALRNWARAAAPALEERFAAVTLARPPRILANESARAWLLGRGVPARHVESAVIERLLNMAGDAATAPRQDFPGGLRVRRRGGILFVDAG